MRKIIQICSDPKAKDEAAAVTALCSDGTVWQIAWLDGAFTFWLQLPPIPQDEPKKG